MLVLYHSRGALQARLAAALHVGLLPLPLPETERDLWQAFAQLGGWGVYQAQGILTLGADTAGHQVCAFGRASRPDVVQRAFTGLASLCAVAGDAYLLQPVGGAVAWGDLRVRALAWCGLSGLARREQRRLIRENWGEAVKAVEEALRRLAGPREPGG